MSAPVRQWEEGGWQPGDVCEWAAASDVPMVRLVCTRSHFAGHAAEHPWDPGAGWGPAVAATLWAPDGEVEAAKLTAAVNGIRDDASHSTERMLELYGANRTRWLRAHSARLLEIARELTRSPMQ